MSSYKKQLQKLLTPSFKVQSKQTKFINELIYGKKLFYFNTMLNQFRSIVLYLHQTNPQILVAIDLQHKGITYYLQLERLGIHKCHFDYERLYDLSYQNYIILQDSQDFIIILFGDPNKSNYPLEEKAKMAQQMNNFYQNITFLKKNIISFKPQIDSTLVKSFLRADTNKDHSLSIIQITYMFNQIKLQNQTIKNDIINYIKQQTSFEKFNYQDFEKISKILCCKQQLIEVFETYSMRLKQFKSYLEQTMDRSSFIKFLLQVQRQTQKQADQIANKVFNKSKQRISFYQFSLFMVSEQNDITSKQYRDQQVDISYPLLNYICFSSNNTYLETNQLLSNYKSQRFYEDLEMGIRCVDIDCFDSEDGPVVKQASSNSRFLSFQSILRQILKFIDSKNVSSSKQISMKQKQIKTQQKQVNMNQGQINRKQKQAKSSKLHTPIILSITNNCNEQNQQKIANSLKKIFGNKILLISEFAKQNYPTLEKAMGKIIIKTKGTIQMYKEQHDEHSIFQNMRMIQQMLMNQGLNLKQAVEKKNSEKQITTLITNQTISGGHVQFLLKKHKFNQKKGDWEHQRKKFKQSENEIRKFIESISKSTVNGSKQESDSYSQQLIDITALFSQGRLGDPNCWECIMLKQEKLFKYYKNQNDRRIISYQSKKGWVRTYPKRLRISNSNFNPLPAIEMGVQIISLNTQNVDTQTLLMMKFFEKGSRNVIGYRLKPKFKNNQQKRIVITPISAMKIYSNDPSRSGQICYSQIKMRFYCYIEDMAKNKQYTKWKAYTEVVKDNAFNPIYEHNSSMILRYTQEELGFVAIKIDNVGLGVIPLSNIRKGYRTVTLYDNHGMPKLSKVFFSVLVDTGKVFKKR